MRLHVTGIVGQRGFVLANRFVEQGGLFQFRAALEVRLRA